MMSFGPNELGALALIEPQTESEDCRSAEAKASLKSEAKINFANLKLVRWGHGCLRTYHRFLEHEAAIAKVYAMTDRELRDIGIARSEIRNQVVSAKGQREANIPGFLRTLTKSIKRSRKARATYCHLMRMENRQLADIGLTRGDINASLLGPKVKYANANLIRASNDNDHRRVG